MTPAAQLSLDGSAPTSSARFSPCRLYRYELRRTWDARLPVLAFCLVNPSTATAEADDPTIRLLCSWARLLGYGGIVVVNLFAWRSTDPAEMKRSAEPIGPENDAAIVAVARESGMVVCAWGANGTHLDRGPAVAAALRAAGVQLYRLPIPLTKSGQPCHPLYKPVRGALVPWEASR